MRRQEVIELQQYYLEKAEDKRAEEQLIEHLTWLESEKQWKMREDKWQKEDQARVNLLRNVYENRTQNVEYRHKLKVEEDWRLAHEKKQIETELERQEREAAEKKTKIELEKKNHQGDVLKQIGERDRNQRREL